MAEQVKFGAGVKEELRSWLHHELFNALSDRLDLERQWSEWIEAFVAPRPGPVDFPWPGATNEEYPLTAMHAEPVYADFMQSLHATGNLWAGRPLSPKAVDFANPLTEFMSVIDRRFIKMRDVNSRALLDLVILGTCVWHDTWMHERRPTRTLSLDRAVEAGVQLIDQPHIGHIPLEDFIWPANGIAVDPDAAVGPARWVARRFRLTPEQLNARAKGQEPWLPNFDKRAVSAVIREEIDEDNQVKEKKEHVERMEPSFDRKIELYEVWLRYDIDGNGIDEDVVVTWHQRTREILRAVHNPFLHGKRPFEVGRYFPGFGMTGIGIAAMNEWAQALSSKFLNATADNVLLSNTVMLGIPQGSMISPDEPVYPGKVWSLAPGETIQDIQIGQVRNDIFTFLAMVQQLAEQRTSVNDLRQGDISSLPSRTPATTVLNLLREGNKKFDMILGSLRDGPIRNLGKRTFQNIWQRSQTSEKWRKLALSALGPDDGGKIVELLSLGEDRLEELVDIEVAAQSGRVNKEVDKQNLIGLMQLAQQLYPQFVQAAQMMGDPQIVMSTTAASYNGGRELWRRLLEAFEIQNPDRYLPPELPQQQGAGNGMQPQQPLAPQQSPQGLDLLQALTALR